ncbi:hypothetical protein OTU49_011666 [Cherax quadricarinatus]|uniref:Uncharacterized protein n=1 Tax=Cherax quadricarinatus TaxID=27406 RepID=A0AAW0W469_CHEQU
MGPRLAARSRGTVESRPSPMGPPPKAPSMSPVVDGGPPPSFQARAWAWPTGVIRFLYPAHGGLTTPCVFVVASRPHPTHAHNPPTPPTKATHLHTPAAAHTHGQSRPHLPTPSPIFSKPFSPPDRPLILHLIRQGNCIPRNTPYKYTREYTHKCMGNTQLPLKWNNGDKYNENDEK